MDPRKRPRNDSDLSSDDETPAKRPKKLLSYCLTEEETMSLLRAKRVFYFDNNISSFTLPQDCCTLEHIKRLNRALLEPSNNLLTFNMTPLSELMSFERVRSVLQSFNNNETLTALNIKHVSLNLTDLAPILEKKRLKSLTISTMVELSSSINDIAHDLIGCTSLTYLDLSHWKQNHLAGIEVVVAGHKRLKSLILSYSKMGPRLLPLVTVIAGTSLTRLDLANMDLTDGSAVMLAQVLEKHPNITYLDISDNSLLTNIASKALVQMLGTNKQITALKLKGTFFDGEVDLFKALEKSNTVKLLTVSIKTYYGVQQLGLAFERWISLSSLTMTCNEIGAISAFLQGIEKTKTLKHLGICKCCAYAHQLLMIADTNWPKSDEDIEKIKRSFSKNRSLISIAAGSYPATLKECFEQITNRNKAPEKTLKVLLEAQNYSGMLDFVEESLKNGRRFEDLVDEADYTTEDYELVLRCFIQVADNTVGLEDEKILTKQLEKSTNTSETLKNKIEAAQREIDIAKKNLDITTKVIATLKSDLTEVQTKMKSRIQSRDKAQDALKNVQEAKKALEELCKREVTSWTINEVGMLLKYFKLDKYVGVFADNLIKGDMLVKLTSPDFQLLGLNFKDAKLIMSALYKLKHLKSMTEVPQSCCLEWKNNRVIGWLKNNALGHLTDQFCTNEITGDELIVLDNYDLIHWLQIKSIADRTALEAAIQKLREKFEGPANNNKIAKEKIPKQFLCPITHEIMKDPVSTMDGHTYERTAIESWLKDHDTSPLTNEKLSSKMLIPNHQLKSLIAEYVKE